LISEQNKENYDANSEIYCNSIFETPSVPLQSDTPDMMAMQTKRNSRHVDFKVHKEKLVEIAADCPVEQAAEPPDREKKIIPRIEYETLIENRFFVVSSGLSI
jgi:hypothetical protein